MRKRDKVLIIGNGGREHALGWKLRQSPQVGGLFFAPGNGGTAGLGRNLEIGAEEIEKLVTFACQEKIDFTIVGPEAPLVAGVVNRFNKAGLIAFGPNKMAARLEGSKAWANNFMKRNKIPCPDFRVFDGAEEAIGFLSKCPWPEVVIKASGLAGGKGVLIPGSKKEAERAIKIIMVEKKFGEAGNKIVIQEKVEGQEVSMLAFTDGNTILPMLSCQDHKRELDGDKGLNTGGMGAYVPTKWVDEEMKKEIMKKIFEPTVKGIKDEGSIYVGVLYAGLMLTKKGPVVLEYNVRFGDPETQPLMVMLKSDLYQIMKACVVGRLKDKNLDFYEGASASVVLVSGGYPKKYEKGKLIKGLGGEEKGVKIFQAGTIRKNGQVYTNGGRVLAITARGRSVEEAIKNSYGVISKKGVGFEGMHYRKDIGLHAGEILAGVGAQKEEKIKYANIEGLGKKDPFKKGIVDFLMPTAKNLSKHGIRIVSQSLGEPAALLDFLDYDFYLAFKTDGVGTKSLIADKMAAAIRKGKKFKGKIWRLYSGLGIDLIASNVNDLICLGAKPIALSDEISAGDYRVFTDPDRMKGLFAGLKKGCLESGITIPCGESPTLPDIIDKKAISITGSSIGLVRPKKRVILGQKLKAGDAIFGLSSSGIHTNGLSLARKIIEKLPQGYFTPFGKKTIGEELLTPTRIYVKPIIEMIDKGVEIHCMSNISGSAFRKIMRAKKDFTYVIEKLPRRPRVLKYLTELDNIPNNEAYETWNMGLGFVIFAPESQEKKIFDISQKCKIKAYKLGWVEKGPKRVVVKSLDMV